MEEETISERIVKQGFSKSPHFKGNLNDDYYHEDLEKTH